MRTGIEFPKSEKVKMNIGFCDKNLEKLMEKILKGELDHLKIDGEDEFRIALVFDSPVIKGDGNFSFEGRFIIYRTNK